MKKRAHWSKKLTKKEKAHLKEVAGCNLVSIEPFKRTIKFQEESGLECFECRQIARKLGLLEA